VSHALKRKW